MLRIISEQTNVKKIVVVVHCFVVKYDVGWFSNFLNLSELCWLSPPMKSAKINEFFKSFETYRCCLQTTNFANR